MGACAVVIGLTINGSAPVLWVAFVVPILALCRAAQLQSQVFVPLAALLLPLTPMPLAVPTLLPLGGISVFFTDVVLPAVALWALAGPRRTPGPDRAMWFYATVILLLALVGLINGAGPSAIIQDARGPVYLVCGYIIATRRVRWSDRRTVLIGVGGVLWWSFLAIVVSLVLGQELLDGRVGQTQAFSGDSKQSLEGIRFLIASKELALVTVLAVVAALLLGARIHERRRVVTLLLVPSSVVVFMGFSRQSIVATLVALSYVVFVAPRKTQTLLRVVVGVTVVGAVLAGLTAAGVTQQLTAEETVVGQQVRAYQERVVEGLFGENVTNDPGNQFRSQENEAALQYAGDNPIFGGGLGVQYRGDLELEAFDDVEYGRRYVHNVYLWYAAHGGLLGLIGVGAILLRPLTTVILRAFRDNRPRRNTMLAAGAPYVAILVIGVVEPVMHTNATAPLVGALLGFFALAEVGAIGERHALPSSPTAKDPAEASR